MASDNLGPVQPQRIDHGLNSRMIFQDEAAAHFQSAAAAAGDLAAQRKPSGFAVDGEESRFVRTQFGARWDLGGRPHSDGSDEEDEDVDDDDLDEGDGLVSVDENNNNIDGGKNGNNSSGSVQSSSEKANAESARNLQDRHSSFGLVSAQHLQNEPASSYENAVTVVQPEFYCGQIMNVVGSSSVQNEVRGENEYGFGGRKDATILADPAESLRTHLLDPLTGVLMDDAMILPCGHSFGSGGIQHVLRMKACKCSRPISEDMVRQNLALQSAVQAFRREEESQSKMPKRRRERFEQERCSYDDSYSMDSRGKGVQFPFSVADRVLIKGNKRTPQRFVGRIAVVTTQCLNGWYVVKTLDNAESVKLQYRSLAKVPDDSPPCSVIQNKAMIPNWL